EGSPAKERPSSALSDGHSRHLGTNSTSCRWLRSHCHAAQRSVGQRIGGNLLSDTDVLFGKRAVRSQGGILGQRDLSMSTRWSAGDVRCTFGIAISLDVGDSSSSGGPSFSNGIVAPIRAVRTFCRTGLLDA